MATLPIIQHPDPRLTQVSRPVADDEFGLALQATLDDMVDSMHAADGAGLAAVQVGDLRRIIVLNLDGVLYRMVNPRIVSETGSHSISEGCLSFPGLNVAIMRSQTVTVSYQDSTGGFHFKTFSDFDAIAVQHELDHLEGKVILDQATRNDRRSWKKSKPKVRKIRGRRGRRRSSSAA